MRSGSPRTAGGVWESPISSKSSGRTCPPSGSAPGRPRRRDSDDRRGDILDDPVAVPAGAAGRVPRPHEEVRLHGFPQVRDAVRVPALQDPHGPIRQPHEVLLRHVVVPDHVHARPRRDQRDLVDLPRAQLPVLHLHDVLPPHRLRRDMHRDGHRGRDALVDPQDLEDLQRHPRGDMVDHGPVLDRRHPELPHPPTPRTISRRAIRTGTALNAWRKYFAYGVRSTAGSISVTRGSGWRTMRSFFASRSSGGATPYEPATPSYSWGAGNRSFWIRVTYSTSAVGTTSSRRCVIDSGVPAAFNSSTISHGISSPGGDTNVRDAPNAARAVAIEWTVRP